MTLIIASRQGQLANQLFLFAHVTAYAMEEKLTVLNPGFDLYASYFEEFRNENCPAFEPEGDAKSLKVFTNYSFVFLFSKILRRLRINTPYIAHTNLEWDESLDLDTAKSPDFANYHLLVGWQFRAPKLLMKHSDILRTFFRPNRELQLQASRFLENIRQNASVVIGVHIRQGDYKTFENGRYYYEIDQYIRWMNQMATQFADKTIAFLVCSNSRLTADQFNMPQVHIAPGHEFVDLLCLSECDYVMGPPSTYSLWASFYGRVSLFHLDGARSIPDKELFKVPEIF